MSEKSQSSIREVFHDIQSDNKYIMTIAKYESWITKYPNMKKIASHHTFAILSSLYATLSDTKQRNQFTTKLKIYTIH
jgi:hypothetical protein